MAIRTVKETAYAKINLFLRMTGLRQDGYHLLSTLMQTVSLCDFITVECTDQAKEDKRTPGISISSNAAGLPVDQRNTAYKAARIFLDALAKENVSVVIYVHKSIPSQAGMGGGSADAAAVLRAMNTLFPGVMDDREMLQAAARIGADVPFCLAGGMQHCRGIGEILTPVEPLSSLPVLLVKPNAGIPTPWAFSEYDRCPPDPIRSEAAETRIMNILTDQKITNPADRLSGVKDDFFNEFEPIAEKRYPLIAAIREALDAEGAAVSRMSGSGSTIYGIFLSTDARDSAALVLQEKFGAQMRLFPAETI